MVIARFTKGGPYFRICGDLTSWWILEAKRAIVFGSLGLGSCCCGVLGCYSILSSCCIAIILYINYNIVHILYNDSNLGPCSHKKAILTFWLV